jgi:ribonucleoside-diphosphate reductase alpha chain
MRPDPFTLAPVARHVWEAKYCLRDMEGNAIDQAIGETWRRVAKATAASEPAEERQAWEDRFFQAMSDYAFLPAGRIIAGAGSGRQVTLFNCFVMGEIADNLDSIFENVREAALTMQQGGGIGHDFSTLRPAGAPVSTLGADASGPVSFMDVWDAMCRTIMSAGARRGAMMGTLRCDHPDIERFIDAKSDPARLRNFNVSVLVTDAFIEAVRSGENWQLQFGGKVYKTIRARALWKRIMRATYDYAEPGVIFIDRINAQNNLAYCETISCTNPCGEQPLPPYGACLLGSINLTRLIRAPFQPDARIETAELEEYVRTGVRLLDNVIDISNYPLDAQRREALAKRRIGLGITGLADALIMCGQRYDSPNGRRMAESWMRAIQNAAYATSSELARERGAFPLFDAGPYLEAPNIARLEPHVRAAIERHGIRNGCVTSIAPTGTISLLAGNVSSGIEPVFDLSYDRRIRNPDNSIHAETVEDYAYALWRTLACANDGPTPETFVTVRDIPAQAHLDMQAALQPWVDSSISKTINCPADMTFESFENLYMEAYDRDLKGCTTYRPNAVTGEVLTQTKPALELATDSAAQDAPGRPFEPATRPAEGLAREDKRVVFMTKPLAREPALAGYTYKLTWPGSPDALYVTINDIERDGRLCPFEIFINTKNLEHYAWTVALTRMISAVFRRGGDVSFVVEELKAIFDPQGGRWIGGKYVPSLLAAIGGIIEKHMLRTGFLSEPLQARATAPVDPAADEEFAVVGNKWASSGRAMARSCPQCGRAGLRRIEGCWVCASCGYSQCG